MRKRERERENEDSEAVINQLATYRERYIS